MSDNNKKKNGAVIFAGIAIVVVVIIVLMVGLFIKLLSGASHKSTEQLLKKVDVVYATPEKGTITMDDTALYDELPEITKYPLAVEGRGDIDIEIFTSGEKAGDNYDSWLVDIAKKFNSSGATLSDGSSVSMSVRSVASGLGGDYILSGKYLPDFWTPSNELFGEYIMSQGADIEEYEERLVGNTAGVLITKGSQYKTIKDVADAVSSGKINLGYTNPQTSATGMNLLMTILKEYGGNDLFSDQAVDGFVNFQKNIPYVAYTTQQMRDSASNGSLDGMCMEYQTYVNEKNLNSLYDFIPFGVRHDNPLYAVNYGGKTTDKKEAMRMVADFCLSQEAQTLAHNKGFNYNDDYKPEYEFSGTEIYKALQTYKSHKDTGKNIIAVFVADCSGSMDGDPINQLKSSLSNGMKYINENNKVGLVSYSSNVTVEVPIAEFDLNQKSYFQGAINNLSAGGTTYSYEAVVVAMDMVEKAREADPDAKVMIFLLSDGMANGKYDLSDIRYALEESKIPVYTISYTDQGDAEALKKLSEVNEAAAINADSDDIVYKIKSLFNSEM